VLWSHAASCVIFTAIHRNVPHNAAEVRSQGMRCIVLHNAIHCTFSGSQCVNERLARPKTVLAHHHPPVVFDADWRACESICMPTLTPLANNCCGPTKWQTGECVVMGLEIERTDRCCS